MTDTSLEKPEHESAEPDYEEYHGKYFRVLPNKKAEWIRLQGQQE